MNKEEVVRQYEKNGFHIFRNVIDADLVAEAREHLAWLIGKYPQFRPEHLHHPLMMNDAFWTRLVTDERLLDIVEMILGPNISVFTSHYICKPPHDGHAVLWHQDGAYWKLEPMEALTIWLAIDSSNPENGCVKMLPGSHRLPLQDLELRDDVPNMLHSSMNSGYLEKSLQETEVVDVILEPGDVSIHHPRIIHGSERNRSSHRRCGLDIGYIPTTTSISNKGLYLNPILARGEALPEINEYRSYPLYKPGNSIPFKGWAQWNEIHGAKRKREEPPLDPVEITHHMIERLKAGTIRV